MSAGVSCAPARARDAFDGLETPYSPDANLLWFTVRMNKGSHHQIVSGRPVYVSLLNPKDLYEKATIDSPDSRQVWPAMDTVEHRSGLRTPSFFGGPRAYFRLAVGFTPAMDPWRDQYWRDNLVTRLGQWNAAPASIATQPH